MNLWLLLFIIWYIIGLLSMAGVCIKGIKHDGILTLENLILSIFATTFLAFTGPIVLIIIFKDAEIWKRKQ